MYLSTMSTEVGMGGDSSGKTDCGQIVMSLGHHRFSWKTFTFQVLAKATSTFILILLWGSLFPYAKNSLAPKGYSPTRRCLRGEEGRNVNETFQMGYLSTFQISAKYLQAVAKPQRILHF